MPWFKRLNIMAECQALRLGPWQCPPFLFLVMGTVIIATMVATYTLASRTTEEPEIAALIVIIVTVFLLAVGNAIIAGFNRVAEANRMKSEFISIVSHQLRSPLSIFKWTVDVLGRELRKTTKQKGEDAALDTSAENFLQTLAETTEKMIRLVNSLLEVSRIEARTFILKGEALSLNELTRGILADFIRYAEASRVSLEFKAAPALPLVSADKERIAMVIQNFIDNAIRYTKGSGSILITTAPDEGMVRWTIQDQGMGIPVSQQKYIFQKFFRAENVGTHQTRGTGIGLYVAKAITEASGGKIGFSSEEGKGSTFWFTLPVKT